MHKALHYYSVWALFLHAMYKMDYIDNTYAIAMFCWVVNNFFVFVWPRYLDWYSSKDILVDLLLHWAPLVLLPYNASNWGILLSSFTIYLAIMHERVWDAYMNPKQYIASV